MSGRAASLCFVAIIATAASAQAYVATRTKGGNPVHWPVSCVVLQPDARGDQSTDTIDANAIATTLTRAIANWNSRVQNCGYIVVGSIPATEPLEAVSDGRPAVVFRSDYWGRGTLSYDPRAIAVTTVWFADRSGDPVDGQISDADIELNAVNYTFTTQPTTAVARTGTTVADLENTLTHEIGHVLGLAHTCWDHKTATPPPDNLGNPAPDCNDTADLPAKVTSATMYPYAAERAVNMRIVGDDDLQGVCDAYPNTKQMPSCYGYIESPGCEHGRSRLSVTGAGYLLLAGLALVVWRVRRRASF